MRYLKSPMRAASGDFFQIVNHGIPSDLIAVMWQQTRDFFALPAEKKEAVMRTRHNPWGYYNNELTKNQRDKKEVFDYTVGGMDPVFSAENRWPDMDSTFRTTLVKYRDECTSLSLRILERMSEGLGLAPDHLEPFFCGRTHRLRTTQLLPGCRSSRGSRRR